jgi:hypothetical protein
VVAASVVGVGTGAVSDVGGDMDATVSVPPPVAVVSELVAGKEVDTTGGEDVGVCEGESVDSGMGATDWADSSVESAVSRPISDSIDSYCGNSRTSAAYDASGVSVSPIHRLYPDRMHSSQVKLVRRDDQ